MNGGSVQRCWPRSAGGCGRCLHVRRRSSERAGGTEARGWCETCAGSPCLLGFWRREQRTHRRGRSGEPAPSSPHPAAFPCAWAASLNRHEALQSGYYPRFQMRKLRPTKPRTPSQGVEALAWRGKAHCPGVHQGERPHTRQLSRTWCLDRNCRYFPPWAEGGFHVSAWQCWGRGRSGHVPSPRTPGPAPTSGLRRLMKAWVRGWPVAGLAAPGL